MSRSTVGFIKRIFDHPYASIAVFIIAFINKLFICIAFYSLSDDKALYSLLALNAIDGHGFTETFYFLQQPEKAYYFINQTIVSPGYSILLAPLLLITGKNIIVSTIIIEGLSLLLFFYIIRATLKYCYVPGHTINIATLLLGFFIYYHERQSTAKDTLSLSLLLVTVLYILRHIQNSSSPVKTAAGSAIMSVVPGIFKLIYLPLFLPLLLMFLIAGYIKKDKKLISTFLWSLFFAGLIFIVWYACINLTTFGTSYPFNYKDWSMTTEGAEFIVGFYPENLVNTFPFVIAGFCNMEWWATEIERLFPQSYSILGIFFTFLNFILFIGLMIQFIILCLKIFRSKLSNRQLFIFTGSLLSVSLVALLCCMSILHKAIHYKGGTLWTYVAEPRSWLLIIVFLQLLVFISVSNDFINSKPIYRRVIQIAFLLILVESVHGAYFSLKTAIQFKKHKEKIASGTNADILADLSELKKKYPGKKVELVAENRPFRWIAYLKGNKVYCNTPALATSPELIPANTVLLVAIQEDDLPVIKNYTTLSNVRFSARRGAYYLYIQESKK